MLEVERQWKAERDKKNIKELKAGLSVSGANIVLQAQPIR